MSNDKKDVGKYRAKDKDKFYKIEFKNGTTLSVAGTSAKSIRQQYNDSGNIRRVLIDKERNKR